MIKEKNDSPSLPTGWAWAKLGEISDIGQGGTPSTRKKEYWNGSIPWLRSGEILFNRITGSKGTITQTGLKNSPAKLLPKGTVLLAMTGEGLTRGRAAILDIEASANQSCAHIMLDPRVMKSEYLFYYFRKEYWNIRQLDKGTNQPGLNTAIIKEFNIPAAPLMEQLRIVSRVEELFARLDAGVEGLRKVKAQLKRYRQAVLKYAFEGKLTEEWRKTHKNQTEPATKLLQQIKQERKKDPKYKELPPIDVFNSLELPENWTWTRLGEIIFLSNERYNPTISEDQRFVGLEHIESNTSKLLGFGKSSETRSTKNRFKQGDLLYGKLRPYLNKVWVANFNGVCSTDILVFQKNNFISNEYLAACLLNQSFVEYTNQHMSGVQHPRVSYQILSQYIIPLPPLLEQLKIAEEVQRSFYIADEVERATEQSLKKAEFLRQSILKVAFEGKIVPQDPSDEPAEKLLERIKEERAKSKGENDINRRKNKPKQLELSTYVK